MVNNYHTFSLFCICTFLLSTNIHFVPPFTNVFALAQVIDVGKSFPRLALGLCEDFFDFWIIL